MNQEIQASVHDMIVVSGLDRAPKTRDARFLRKVAHVLEALHKVAPRAATCRHDPEGYMTRCVLMAHAAQDVLLELGVRSTLVPCSFAVLREDFGRPSREIMIGDLSQKAWPGRFNGHLVLRGGDTLIDPVAGQAGRRWNALPKAIISRVAKGRTTWTHPITGRDFAAIAIGESRVLGQPSARQRWAYLRRPSLEANHKAWSAAPDAEPQERVDLVQQALEAYRSGSLDPLLVRATA